MMIRLKRNRVLILVLVSLFLSLIIYELSSDIKHAWILCTEPVISFYDPERYRSLMETKPKDADTNLTALLDWNPVYRKFAIPNAVGEKKKVTLLLIVSTAPRRFDRRKAIRETFWKHCKNKDQIVPECLFLTDKTNPDSEYFPLLETESKTHNDMRFQNLKGGVEFGDRIMYHMLYALKNYNFDYFLRMDDDYFLCLDKLLLELPLPAAEHFHWGWVHKKEPVVRPEESMFMLSCDLVIQFLTQEADKIKCSPLADQLIGHWAHEMGILNVWRHDDRLVHDAMINEAPKLINNTNICQNYMGIHGAYPDYMRQFWAHKGKTLNTSRGTLKTNSKLVEGVPFDWRYFVEKWRFKPKFCLDKPEWEMFELLRNTNKGSYGGRQEAKD